MPYNREKHHRRSIRLSGYDYSSPGAYFVTICVHGGECLLGAVVEDIMRLNHLGQIASESWQWLGERYPYVRLDAWVVMPNHVHGIVVIQQDMPYADQERGSAGRGGSRTAPTGTRKTLGRLIGTFKTVSTKRINELRAMPGVPFWQRNYWEHIVRSEESLNRMREYIENNPARWPEDQLHPDAPPGRFNRWQP